MKMSEIRDLAAGDLQKKAESMNKDLFQMKMKHSMGQLANPIQIRDLRRDLARVKMAQAQAAGKRG